MSIKNVIFCILLIALINYFQSTSTESCDDSDNLDQDYDMFNRKEAPQCEDYCDQCNQIILEHEEEFNNTCDIYSDYEYQESFCWAQYIKFRCFKEIARKYCQPCNLFEAYENYTNAYINYMESRWCHQYPSHPCREIPTTTESYTDPPESNTDSTESNIISTESSTNSIESNTDRNNSAAIFIDKYFLYFISIALLINIKV
jgi:hypothetical protein